MHYDRDELLARTDLAALADELLGWHKGNGCGARWPSPVPGHDQTGRTPPMSIFVDHRGTQRWTCFATGARGTAIDLVAVARTCSVADAIDALARRAGLDPTPTPTAVPAPRAAPPAPHEPAPLPAPSPVIEAHVAACERLLWTPPGAQVRTWLGDERGFSHDVLRHNRVGADPGRRHLRRPSGLPRAGPAAILPALDTGGRAVYFQARYVCVPPERDKFDNPVARLAANPRTTLIRAASPRPGAERVVLVCEGIPDALTAATAGFDAWAVFGAGYPDARVAARIDADGRGIVSAFDGDAAGRPGSERLHQLLAARGRRVGSLALGVGDLGDWARRAGPAFGDLLAVAVELGAHGRDSATVERGEARTRS